MSNKHKQANGLGADINNAVKSSIQAGANKGVLVPTIPEFAAQEALMIQESTATRISHWLKVIPAYADDIDSLMRYPAEVKKAWAKLMGFDLSKHRSKWVTATGAKDTSKIKAYDAFVANQVSGLSLICELVKEKGQVHAVALLSGIGTLPQKLTEARIMLGRPLKARGTKSTGNHGVPSGKSWQDTMTDLKNKRPVEVAIILVASYLTSTDCMTLLKGIEARLSKSEDSDEKIAGQMVKAALEEFERNINKVEAEQQVPESNVEPIAGAVVAATVPGEVQQQAQA